MNIFFNAWELFYITNFYERVFNIFLYNNNIHIYNIKKNYNLLKEKKKKKTEKKIVLVSSFF